MTKHHTYQAPSIGLVAYGDTTPWQQGLGRLRRQLQAHQLLLANNDRSGRRPHELEGDNSAFEFSAYVLLCRSLEGEGPFILLNDTLFKTHWQWGWLKLLQHTLKNIDSRQQAIWGDMRNDGDTLAERPNPFLASWVFVIPNRQSLVLFADVLDCLCKTDLPEPSPAYAEFLDWWTAPNRRWRGWHGNRSDEELLRKKRSIMLEHALSKALAQNSLPIRSLGSFAPAFYQLIRLTDRLRTRLKSIIG